MNFSKTINNVTNIVTYGNKGINVNQDLVIMSVILTLIPVSCLKSCHRLLYI